MKSQGLQGCYRKQRGCELEGGKKRNTEIAEILGIPLHPRCFLKRGCKLLKTKDGSRKKSIKRLQAIDKSRVRGGAAGGVREVSSR